MTLNLSQSNNSNKTNIIVRIFTALKSHRFWDRHWKKHSLSCHIMDWFYWIEQFQKKGTQPHVRSQLCTQHIDGTSFLFFPILSQFIQKWPIAQKKDPLTLSPVENYSAHMILIYSTERYLRLMCRLDNVQFNSIHIAHTYVFYLNV